MTAPTHFTHIDSRTGIISFELIGSFDAAAFARLAAARTIGIDKLLATRTSFRSLVDLRQCDVVTKDLVDSFSQMFSDPTRRAERMALIVDRALTRLQVRRMTAQRADARIFHDLESGMAWLTEHVPNEC